jgi:hypothetical protein
VSYPVTAAGDMYVFGSISASSGDIYEGPADTNPYAVSPGDVVTGVSITVSLP